METRPLPDQNKPGTNEQLRHYVNELGIYYQLIQDPGDMTSDELRPLQQEYQANWQALVGFLKNSTPEIINEGDYENNITALQWIIAFSDLAVIQILVEYGADVNLSARPRRPYDLVHPSPNARRPYDAASPLHRAIEEDCPLEIIKFLIEKGANPLALNGRAMTPLDLILQKKAAIELAMQKQENKRNDFKYSNYIKIINYLIEKMGDYDKDKLELDKKDKLKEVDDYINCRDLIQEGENKKRKRDDANKPEEKDNVSDLPKVKEADVSVSTDASVTLFKKQKTEQNENDNPDKTEPNKPNPTSS